MKKFFQIQMKYRVKYIVIITLVVSVLLGLINVCINFNQVSKLVSKTEISYLWGILIIPIMAIFVELFYGIVLALVCYFTGAVMALGLDIKNNLKLSFRILIFFPIILLSDTIGYLTIGMKLTDVSFWGILTYIPFYILTFINAYSLTPLYMQSNKKQTLIISIILTLTMIFISYPMRT